MQIASAQGALDQQQKSRTARLADVMRAVASACRRMGTERVSQSGVGAITILPSIKVRTSESSSGGYPAIDADDLAGEVGGPIAAQK